jgi:hypothetical protein
MRRNLTKLLVLLALANIVVGLVLLIGYRFTVLPLIVWLRQFSDEQLGVLISFLAKSELALGLVLLVVAALVGRRLIDK